MSGVDVYFLYLLFFWLWNSYNILPFPLLPLNSSLYPSLLYFKFMFFIITTFIYVYVYAFILLNIFFSVSVMLLVCMSLRLTIGYWISNWCICLWGRWSLPLSAFLSACSSLCRAEALWAFPIHLNMSIDVVFVQLMFRPSCCSNVMGVVSDVTRRHNLTANFWVLWFL